MAVPKRKTSKSKRNQRRSHHALKRLFNIGFDKVSGEPHLSHHVAKDGYYGGRQVVVTAAEAVDEMGEENTTQA